MDRSIQAFDRRAGHPHHSEEAPLGQHPVIAARHMIAGPDHGPDDHGEHHRPIPQKEGEQGRHAEHRLGDPHQLMVRHDSADIGRIADQGQTQRPRHGDQHADDATDDLP
jgi:hypothetical protein